MGRAFSIFRQKMDSPNPSEMDIKVSIPASTFLFTVLQSIFPKWKRKNISLVGKNGVKIKSKDCMTLNILTNINKHHPHVHFINNNSSLVLTAWKGRENSSTTSLLLIRTSSTCGFRNGSVFTTAWQSNSRSNVTRLVATEHVWNKYSLQEFIHLKSVVLRTASI